MIIAQLFSTGITLKGKSAEGTKDSNFKINSSFKKSSVEIKNDEHLLIEPKSLNRFESIRKYDRGDSFYIKKDIGQRISEDREKITHKETIKAMRR